LQGARTISYRPITDESNLVYLDWITANRRRVEMIKRVASVTSTFPIWARTAFANLSNIFTRSWIKKEWSIDVRANGGGNVSRMLIERLRRKVLGINYSRTSDLPNTYPDAAFFGPMAAILNENSSSDGDIFPYMFREAGLGPLIGKRSWGGVVGISGRGGLIDGGIVSVPESALVNTKGEYIIEGYGVDPDIEVENDPKSVIAGGDPQLERAVGEVMKKLTNAVKLPARPAAPVKTN
jgi:tricorn protease